MSHDGLPDRKLLNSYTAHALRELALSIEQGVWYVKKITLDDVSVDLAHQMQHAKIKIIGKKIYIEMEEPKDELQG